MGNLFRLSLIAVLAVMLCSCDEEYESYNVKIVNDSNHDISVYNTESFRTDIINNTEVANPIGCSITIPKGECFEYTLYIYKEDRKNAYVAFLFSDKKIDIDTDILNQEPDDSESRKLLFLKYSLWELIQMDCTVTFNGFENE